MVTFLKFLCTFISANEESINCFHTMYSKSSRKRDGIKIADILTILNKALNTCMIKIYIIDSKRCKITNSTNIFHKMLCFLVKVSPRSHNNCFSLLLFRIKNLALYQVFFTVTFNNMICYKSNNKANYNRDKGYACFKYCSFRITSTCNRYTE